MLAAGTRLTDVVEAVFRGPLAEAGCPPREGQIAMARAVAETIDEAPPGEAAALAVEAATGLGKGLGYLVPAVVAIMRNNARKPPEGSERRNKAIVSTANIALQRQLIGKDIPMLSRALGVQIRAAQMKGRSNYVCSEKLDTASRIIDEHAPFVREVREWLDGGGSGDREDLPGVVDPRGWARVSVSAEECLGPECPFAAKCCSNKLRIEAEKADVIVVNHSFLALAHKKLAVGAVALLADEAHELEDALRRARAAQVYETTGSHWAKVLDRYGAEPEVGAAVRRVISDVCHHAQVELGQEQQRRLLPGWRPEADADALREAFGPARKFLSALAASLSEQADETDNDEEARSLKRRAVRAEKEAEQLGRLAGRLAAVVLGGDGYCAWVERDERRGSSVSLAPVAVKVPPGFPAVVLASATLAIGGRTAKAAESLGLEGASEMVLASPWPIERMAVAIVPKDAPDVNDERWQPWAAKTVVDFAHEMRGGVLVLATSHRRARVFADALRGAGLPWTVRVQGEAGRAELIRWMAEDRDGILVGTRSLFQGVDIQGDALRGVVLDRVPFPSPGDPLEQAIGEVIEAEGGDAFRDRSLVVACALLRQAAGRLLRSPTDRGAVLLLDRRITGSRYRRLLLGALAPMALSGEVADAGRVLRGEPLRGISGSTVLPPPVAPARPARPGRQSHGQTEQLPFNSASDAGNQES